MSGGANGRKWGGLIEVAETAEASTCLIPHAHMFRGELEQKRGKIGVENRLELCISVGQGDSELNLADKRELALFEGRHNAEGEGVSRLQGRVEEPAGHREQRG